MFQCSGCDESFFNSVVRMLRINVLLEGDCIFKQGELGDRMYFIKTGYLQIGTPDKRIIFASKGPGSYLGELTLFNQGIRRNASAWSLSDCILFTLETKDFNMVLARYDTDKKLYNEMKAISEAASCRQRSLNTSTAYVPQPEPSTVTSKVETAKGEDGWLLSRLPPALRQRLPAKLPTLPTLRSLRLRGQRRISPSSTTGGVGNADASSADTKESREASSTRGAAVRGRAAANRANSPGLVASKSRVPADGIR